MLVSSVHFAPVTLKIGVMSLYYFSTQGARKGAVWAQKEGAETEDFPAQGDFSFYYNELLSIKYPMYILARPHIPTSYEPFVFCFHSYLVEALDLFLIHRVSIMLFM